FIIDEYPDMTLLEPAQTIHSMFRQIVDTLPLNIKLILSGSQLDMMKSLLDSANPLFGRFHIVIKLEDFNYMEAASCYPQAPVYEKVGFYSVFGGLPFIARELDESKSLKESILRLLLPQHGKTRMYLENILLNELRKTAFGWGILSIIGNRKATYKDIEDRLGKNTNGLLARQLETMENMELITKVYPINAYGDKKKSFYEIKNNLIRFYFTYIYENKGRLEWVDEGLFYDRYIAPSINTFISYRFEEIVGDYFKLLARKGLRLDIEDVGRYWYNDKGKHQNGEFDCALRTETGYEIYEVKYFSKAMTEKECREEQEQVNSIPGLTIRKLGFASVNGFTFSSGQWNLLEGKDLYNVRN
ncbi:MAG: hypothetical protein KBS81_08385, partial [Spirochaetales bacterium]|nr:hypothetical protein [Candidatus Physcosoma equi]